MRISETRPYWRTTASPLWCRSKPNPRAAPLARRTSQALTRTALISQEKTPRHVEPVELADGHTPDPELSPGDRLVVFYPSPDQSWRRLGLSVKTVDEGGLVVVPDPSVRGLAPPMAYLSPTAVSQAPDPCTCVPLCCGMVAS